MFFFKWANPGLFFVFFGRFKQTLQIFTTNKYEKMISQSSIQHWDSNSRTLNHESSPITTRPGLPPLVGPVLYMKAHSDELWQTGAVGEFFITVEAQLSATAQRGKCSLSE